MSSANKITTPYGTTDAESFSIVTAILAVYHDNIKAAAKRLGAYIAANIGSDDGNRQRVTVECSGLSAYTLTNQIIQKIKESSPELIDKMVNSRSAQHRVAGGVIVKPKVLIKQLIYWLVNEQYFYQQKDEQEENDSPEFDQWAAPSSIPELSELFGEDGDFCGKIQSYFRDTIKESWSSEKDLSEFKIFVSVDDIGEEGKPRSGNLTPVVSVKHAEPGWHVIEDGFPVKRERAAKPVKPYVKPAAAGKPKAAAAAAAPHKPSLKELTTGEPPKAAAAVPKGKWVLAAAKPAPETASAPAAAAGGGGGPAPQPVPVTPAAAPAPTAVKSETPVTQPPAPATPAAAGGAAPQPALLIPSAVRVAPAAPIKTPALAAIPSPGAETVAAVLDFSGAVSPAAPINDQMVIELGAAAVDHLVKAFGFSPAVFATAEAAARAAVSAPLFTSEIAGKVMEAMMKAYSTPGPAGSPITELFKISFKVAEVAVKLRR